MWLNILSMGLKTAGHIYKNKQRTKMLMSDAQSMHAEKMARGVFEYFKQLPYWYQAIFIGIVSAIYGLKGADIMRKPK